MKEDYYIDKLTFLLKNEIKKLNKNKKYALAFSGGLDSCILAKLMLNEKLKVEGYVVGVGGCYDIKNAKGVSKNLKLKLKVITLSENEIKKASLSIKRILRKDANPDSISFNMPLYFVAKRSKEKIIVSGNGADELFGGYAKYLKLNQRGFKRINEKDIINFINKGISENKLITKKFGKGILLPYSYKKIVGFAEKVPLNLKINKKCRKYILRLVGKKLGMNQKIIAQDKKAAQYGSGVIWVMKKLAKRKGVHISKYIKELK